MKKIFIVVILLGFLYPLFPQTEVFIVRNKLDTLRIDVDDLKGGLGTTLLPPSDLIAIGDTNRFYLYWTDNSSNEDGFYLSVSTDGSDWSTSWTVPEDTDSTSYNVSGDGVTRYFRISAYLGGLETAKITCEPAQTLDLRDLTAPYTPYNLTATGGLNEISLAWDDSSSDAAKYYIYRSSNTVPADITPYDSTTAKSYKDDGLGYSKIWHYRVRNRDASYNYSDYSNDASDTTNAQFIQDTTASDNPNIFSVLFEGNSLVEFSSSVGAQFSATSASNYSGAYGGEMYFDGVTNTSYGIESYEFPDTTFISFRVKIGSGITSTATFKYFTLAEFRRATDYALRFYVQTGGAYTPTIWGCYYKDSTGTNSYSSATLTTDVWHLIEIKYKKDATTGGAEIWIDSTKNATLSKADRNTSGNTLTEIRFGSTYASGIFSGGSAYFDEIYGDSTRLGGDAIITDTIPAPDTTPPTAPSNIVASGKYNINSDPNLSYVDVNWTDASSDEAKFYIYRGAKNVLGGNLALLDSVNANVNSWRDATIALTDTLSFYEYGLTARDASYNYSAITSTQRDSAYLVGQPDTTTSGTGTTESTGWFVNINSTGVSDGKSYTTAWRNLNDSSATNPDGINYNLVSAGDTIWVAQGSYGNWTPSHNGTYSDYLHYVKATSTGYNGTVQLGTITLGNQRHCIEFNGFNLARIDASSGGYTDPPIYHLRFKNLTFDIITTTTCVNMTKHPRYIEFINCWFRQSNTSSSQTDMIFLRGTVDVASTGDVIENYADSIFLIGNTFISDNQDPAPHSDGFQYLFCANVWTEGNKFYCANNKTSYTQQWYGNAYRGKAWFLNNLFYASTPTSSAQVYVQATYITAKPIDSVYYVDNTVVFNGTYPNGRMPWITGGSGGYKYVLYNNIQVGSGLAATGVGIFDNPNSMVANYNQWYNSPQSNVLSYNGTNRTFAAWQGLGFDANGLNTQPSFTSFTWLYSKDPNVYLNYNFNIPSPTNGSAFTTSFGGHTYTSDGKIGAVIE